MVVRLTIDAIEIPTRAYFYRIDGRLTNLDLRSLLNSMGQIRLGVAVKHRRMLNGRKFLLSYAIFEFTKEPPFLPGQGLRERRYGFVAFLEIDGYLVVFRTNAGQPEAKLQSELDNIGAKVFSKLFLNNNSEYSRLSTRAMSVSATAERSRTVQGRDLKNAISRISASRSIVKSLTHHTDGAIYASSPSSGSFSEEANKGSWGKVGTWAISVVDAIRAFVDTPGFLDNFAEPLDFGAEADNLVPTSILLDAPALLDALEDGTIAEAHLVSKDRTTKSALGAAKLRSLVTRLDSALGVARIGSDWCVRSGRLTVGRLRFNKKSIALASPLLQRFRITDNNGSISTLEAFFNQGRKYLVTFADPTIGYGDAGLYRDRRILGNLEGLLAVLSPDPALESASSEKNLDPGANAWASASLFAAIESKIVQGSSTVVCDDLGDEWADYVHLQPDDNPPKMVFYHAKHSKRRHKASASALQEVVSQAIKNLGRMTPNASELDRKQVVWESHYSNSTIPRIRTHHSYAQVVHDFTRCLTNPYVEREAVLVVNALSFSKFKSVIEAASSKSPTGAQTTLIWLLSNFVSACQEVGVKPRVMCRP